MTDRTQIEKGYIERYDVGFFKKQTLIYMEYKPGDVASVKLGRNQFPVKLIKKAGDHLWQVQLCNETVPSAVTIKESEFVDVPIFMEDCAFPPLITRASRKNRRRRRRSTRRRA